MIVQCSKCEKKYKIESSKVTDKGAKITCPNCGNVFVVRKKADEEEQADFIPCSLCGSPASIGLDTDKPICERCREIEEQKAARFVPMQEDDRFGSPMDRELNLKTSGNVSFDSLSGGDFSHGAYSTDILPGKGKDYVAPDEIIPTGKGMVKEEDKVPFDQLAAPMQETHAKFITGAETPQTRTEKIAEPTPAPKPPRVEQPPPPQKKTAPLQEPTPAPKRPTPIKQSSPPPKPPVKEPVKTPIDLPPISEPGSLVSDIATVTEPPPQPKQDKPAQKAPRETATKDKAPIKETGPQEIHQEPAKKTSAAPLIIAAVLMIILVVYILILFHPWRP